MGHPYLAAKWRGSDLLSFVCAWVHHCERDERSILQDCFVTALFNSHYSYLPMLHLCSYPEENAQYQHLHSYESKPCVVEGGLGSWYDI